jgi:rhomboid family GlyGly-CTERM serine protease
MVTIALSLLAVVASFLPGEALELTRGLGEPWRLVTGHFTHWNAQHLLWDVVAFFALGLACERRNRAAFVATMALGAVLIPLAVWTFAPEISAYRGLSGLASAAFVLLLVQMRNRWAMLFGLLLAAKIGFELATGATLFTSDLGGAVPVPVAHIAGAVAALVVGPAVGRPSTYTSAPCA